MCDDCKDRVFLENATESTNVARSRMHVTNALPGHSIRAVYPKTKYRLSVKYNYKYESSSLVTGRQSSTIQLR